MPKGDKLPIERQHLVEENIALAYHLAKKHTLWEQGNIMSLEDRQGEALLALVEAARTWDEGRAPFGAYAAQTIKNRLIQATQSYAQPYNLSWKAHAILRDMKRAVADGVENTPRAIAEALDINISKINELWAYHLGANVNMESYMEETIEDKQDVEEEVILGMAKSQVLYAVSTLPPTHRKIVELRFGFADGVPKLSTEIQKELKISKGQYVAMEAAALRALQSLLAKLRDK